jgi:hypothetical protein
VTYFRSSAKTARSQTEIEKNTSTNIEEGAFAGWTRKRSTRIPKPADLSVFRQLTSKGYNVKDFKKKKEF